MTTIKGVSMATDGSSDNSESNGAIMGFEAMLWAAADKLRNNMDSNKERKKQIIVFNVTFLN